MVLALMVGTMTPVILPWWLVTTMLALTWSNPTGPPLFVDSGPRMTIPDAAVRMAGPVSWTTAPAPGRPLVPSSSPSGCVGLVLLLKQSVEILVLRSQILVLLQPKEYK